MEPLSEEQGGDDLQEFRRVAAARHVTTWTALNCRVRSKPFIASRGAHWQLLTYGVGGEGGLKMAYPNFFS